MRAGFPENSINENPGVLFMHLSCDKGGRLAPAIEQSGLADWLFGIYHKSIAL